MKMPGTSERLGNEESGISKPVGVIECEVTLRSLRKGTELRSIFEGHGHVLSLRQGAVERQASVAQTFRVARGFAGLSIAIVDDVVTTGATVNALAAELRAAGAVRCVAIALARTPEPAQGRNV